MRVKKKWLLAFTVPELLEELHVNNENWKLESIHYDQKEGKVTICLSEDQYTERSQP